MARSTDHARSWAGGEGRAGVEVEVGVEVEAGVEGEVEAWGEGCSSAAGSTAGGKGVQIGFAVAGIGKRSVGAGAGPSSAASCQAIGPGSSSEKRTASGGGGSDSMDSGGPGSRGLSAKQRRQRSARGGSGCEQRWQSMWRNVRGAWVGSTILPPCRSGSEALFTAPHGGAHGHSHREGHV